jgi:hypothetical protein
MKTKALLRSEAQQRAKQRSLITDERQLAIIVERPGQSSRELHRLAHRITLKRNGLKK